MIIGIDARFYGPIGKGLGRYTQRLIENLEKIDQKNQYCIFLNDQNWAEYQPGQPNFVKVRFNCRWYGLAEQMKFPRLIRRLKIDLMHFPHFNVAIFCPCPYLVTIHDLILLKYPTRRASTLGPIRYFIKKIGYYLVIRQAVQASQKIITVSNFTKNEILKNFPKLDSSKIAVTYEACDSVESGQLSLPETERFKGVLTKKFFLYVGNAYPHKNLEKLVLVFKKIEERRPGLYQLALVGKEDYFYKKLNLFAHKLIQDLNKVVFLGHVSQPQLANLYRQATLYVFPSLLEGFGLPPLEAMRYSLPVAAANNSSCPEILGDAAVYFDPTNETDMMEKILEAAEDRNLREVLMSRGAEQIKKYQWRRCAEQTLAIYQSLSQKQ